MIHQIKTGHVARILLPFGALCHPALHAFASQVVPQCAYLAGNPVQVSDFRRAGVDFYEATIALNPENAANLIVSATFTSPLGFEGAASFHSKDGGASWTESALPGQSSDGGIDTNVVFDGNGRAYYFAITNVAPNISALRMFISENGGLSWRSAARLPRDVERTDRPIFVRDPLSRRGIYAFGLGDGRRVVLWSSADGGKTWRKQFVAPNGHPRIVKSNQIIGTQSYSSTISTFGNGDLLLPFFTFTSPALATEIRSGLVQSHFELASYFSIGSDHGQSVSVPRRVPMIKAGSSAGFAVDRGHGQYRDRIYAAWLEDDKAASVRLKFSSSSDRGVTWRSAIDLAAALTSVDSRTRQFVGEGFRQAPAIEVNGAGDIMVSWNRFDVPVDFKGPASDPTDPRAAHKAIKYLQENVSYQRVFAISRNGGDTFSTPARLTPVPSRVGRGAVDYLNIAVGRDGKFHSIWYDAHTGVGQLWYSPIRLRCGGQVPAPTPSRPEQTGIVSASRLSRHNLELSHPSGL